MSDPKNQPPKKLSEVLGELQTDYLDRFPQKLAHLREVLRSENLELMQSEFHKIKGNGKTYGLPMLTTFAQLVDDGIEIQPTFFSTQVLAGAILILEKIYVSYRDQEHFDLKQVPMLIQLEALIREGKRKA